MGLEERKMIKLLSLLASVTFSVNNITPITELIKINSKKENSIDISIANGALEFWEVDYYNYNLFDLEYKSLTVAADLINKYSNIEIEWDDFQVVHMINLFDNNPVKPEDMRGANGAGHTNIVVKVVPNNSGNDKGLYGELDFFITMVHNTVDLTIWNDKHMTRKVYKQRNTLNMVLRAKSNFFNENLNIPKYPTFYWPETIGVSFQVYDIKDNKPFTNEELDKLKPNETRELYCFIFPTTEGRARGVLGSARAYFTYYHG